MPRGSCEALSSTRRAGPGAGGLLRRAFHDGSDRVRQRFGVARRDEDPRVPGHRMRDRARDCRDHRKPARECLGERHPVPLEARGEDEDGGTVVESGNFLAGALPRELDAVAEALVVDESPHPAEELPIPCGGAREDAPPLPLLLPCECPDEDILSLPGHEGADAEEHDWIARRGSLRGRCGIRSGDNHTDTIQLAAARGDPLRGVRTRDDESRNARERLLLPRAEEVPCVRWKPGLVRGQVMDERDDRAVPGCAGRHFRQGGEGKAVDQRRGLRRKCGEDAADGVHGPVVWKGKASREGRDGHRPPPVPKRRHHPAVVDVAAGSLLERAGNEEAERPGRSHTGPS